MIKLNEHGFDHIFLLFFVAILGGIVGTYFIVAGHANPVSSQFIDVSEPQCDVLTKIGHHDYGIVGLNGTKLDFAVNPCVRQEVKHFDTYDLYVGTNYPSAHCSEKLTAYACGVKAGKFDLKVASKYNLRPGAWWIDVEAGQGISWTDTHSNTMFLKGMAVALRKNSAPVGYYSNKSHWAQITGNARLKGPKWYAAGEKNKLSAGQSVHDFCKLKLGGNRPIYVQFVKNDGGLDDKLDYNITC
jgi:hypothetical protein